MKIKSCNMRHNFTEEDIQELIYLANENSCNAREYGLLRNFIDKIVKRQKTLASIKEGSKVRILSLSTPGNDTYGIVECINGNKAKIAIDNYCCVICLLTDLDIIERIGQIDPVASDTAESCEIPDANNHDLGAIKIPVEVDIQDGYWEAYSADLARDIAVKCAGTDVRSPKEIADYATEIARSVVENLKK